MSAIAMIVKGAVLDRERRIWTRQQLTTLMTDGAAATCDRSITPLISWSGPGGAERLPARYLLKRPGSAGLFDRPAGPHPERLS